VPCLGFHLLRDAHALQQFGEVNAAGTPMSWIGIGDSFCVQQSLLEGVRRRNVGLWRPLLDDHSHAGTGEGCLGSGARLVVLCQSIEALLGQHHKIGAFAGLHAFDKNGRGRPADIELVSADFFELGSQFFERRLHTDGAKNLDLGRWSKTCICK
jgi:hypothetical protein